MEYTVSFARTLTLSCRNHGSNTSLAAKAYSGHMSQTKSKITQTGYLKEFAEQEPLSGVPSHGPSHSDELPIMPRATTKHAPEILPFGADDTSRKVLNLDRGRVYLYADTASQEF